MPDLSNGEFKKLHGKLGSDGGFTVNPRTGEAVSSGISVAPAGNELRIPAARTSPQTLSNYHQDPGNQERFTRGASFGGWRSENSGDDFIDTPTVYQNSAGGQSRARNQMLKSNQLAGFRLDDFEELTNPHHAENKSKEVSTSDDSPETQAAWRDMPRSVTKGKKITPSEGMSFS
jgi:hypothetical protein